MFITHQQIADRLEALDVEHSKAYQDEADRIATERKGLQEMCGIVGHIWASNHGIYSSDRRGCVVCQTSQPSPTEQTAPAVAG